MHKQEAEYLAEIAYRIWSSPKVTLVNDTNFDQRVDNMLNFYESILLYTNRSEYYNLSWLDAVNEIINSWVIYDIWDDFQTKEVEKENNQKDSEEINQAQ